MELLIVKLDDKFINLTQVAWATRLPDGKMKITFTSGTTLELDRNQAERLENQLKSSVLAI